MLTSQLFLLQIWLEDLKNEVSSILADHKRFMVTMNTNVKCIATQPVVRSVSTNAVAPIMPKLLKPPSDMYL